MPTVRDRLWLWGHEVGAHNGEWGLPGVSRITPAEAAQYLGMTNVIMGRYSYKKPVDLGQYLPALAPVNRVLVTTVGAAGLVEGDEVGRARDWAIRYPNICGIQLDDFFEFRPGQLGGRLAVHTPEELRAIKERLRLPDRQLEIWVAYYTHQVDMPIEEHLNACDVVESWTWRARDFDRLEQDFEQLERKVPPVRKALGFHFWNYGEKEPMPMATYQRVCGLALRLLREKRIDAIVFGVSCVVDMGLETVEWVRRWVAEVGNEDL